MNDGWTKWDKLACKIGIHQWCWMHYVYMASFRECNRCGKRA